MHTALLNALLLMAAQAAETGAQPPIVLACNLPTSPATVAAAATPAERVFRIAPGSLQEWDVEQQRFGQNLCEAYACARSPTRAEASVSSATVSFTVGVEYSTRTAYWRVLGASGLKTTEGSCRIVPAPTPGGS
ncbi:hypothetical protein [Phenylobacterium sp.]|jgi:hypothetical protein|uniref:hypothetical protein n=1 Tax=Phenylobacterium sp. TaxID=1871053 RepID=UPI002E37AB75|nr:hypothetical protein [Phenylobacterium sp.]HEX4709365.1 hypothetical protein [Phenylobacterium sp.]